MHGDPFTALCQFAAFGCQATLSAVAVFFVLDVLVGLVLLVLWDKKRHLWWLFPLLNATAYFALTQAPPLRFN